ncbi:MAG: dicarboxylate/amino acid:cation symporter [Bacteroidales bacterium]
MKKIKIGLLTKVVAAIILGIASSYIMPNSVVRGFVTFNSIFGNFLGFTIPMIILGLVAPGIADLGKTAGKLLVITTLIAYLSTVLAGYFSFFVTEWSLPLLIDNNENFNDLTQLSSNQILHYFTIDMPPVMSVTSALILAFILGLGVSGMETNHIKNILSEFRELVTKIIVKAIIPLLPIYIFGIFLKIASEGQANMIMRLFFKVIIVIFVMHIILLLIQFSIAGFITGKNPLKALVNMLPAYMTALGTQSSAATIPVTLSQAKKNGVDPDLADFVIPLCATIHLSGSMLKIVSCAFAIMWIMDMPCSTELFSGFIFLLAITMVAAPGVPGGAIMAAIGVLQSTLLFDEQAIGLMIALYIAMDSFGTACNVTGDGAIAMIVNKINRKFTAQTQI